MDFQKLSLEKGIIYLFNKEHSRYTHVVVGGCFCVCEFTIPIKIHLTQQATIIWVPITANLEKSLSLSHTHIYIYILNVTAAPYLYV